MRTRSRVSCASPLPGVGSPVVTAQPGRVSSAAPRAPADDPLSGLADRAPGCHRVRGRAWRAYRPPAPSRMPRMGSFPIGLPVGVVQASLPRPAPTLGMPIWRQGGGAPAGGPFPQASLEYVFRARRRLPTPQPRGYLAARRFEFLTSTSCEAPGAAFFRGYPGICFRQPSIIRRYFVTMHLRCL
jgi:hypothetical protein